MSLSVYRDYTQSELDRNFDQRAWAPNLDEVMARRVHRNALARQSCEYRADIVYGDHVDERLDLFMASAADAPIVVFIHGGAWKNFAKEDYLFLGAAYAAAGAHCAILNFSNLPMVRMPEMVAQVRRGLAWLYRNAAAYGGDPTRIFVCGHSSGAHLAAMMLVTDWRPHKGLPESILRGGFCISGIYDLAPVLLSSRGTYVRLDRDEEKEFSPIHHLDRLNTPILVAWGESDSDEFRRQSRDFAEALRKKRCLAGELCLKGVNHFEMLEHLADPASTLAQAVRQQLRLTPE